MFLNRALRKSNVVKHPILGKMLLEDLNKTDVPLKFVIDDKWDPVNEHQHKQKVVTFIEAAKNFKKFRSVSMQPSMYFEWKNGALQFVAPNYKDENVSSPAILFNNYLNDEIKWIEVK